MPIQTELLLVRHAPIATYGLCYGRSDVPMQMDAQTAAQRVLQDDGLHARPIECVFASVSQRCAGVAQALAEKLDVALRLDSRLQELDFGLWEQRTYDEIYRTERALFDAWAHDPMRMAPPRGESGNAMVERVYSWALEVRAGSVLVVTHAGVIRILRAMARRAQELGNLQNTDCDSLTLDWSSAVEPLQLEQLTLMG